MKIAFLIRSLNIGGAERQLVTLVKALDKNRFNISVLYFYSGGELEQELKATGVQVLCLKKRGRWDFLGFFCRLVDCLKNIHPTVLHGYLGTANLLAVFIKLFLPEIQVVWGIRASNVDLIRYDWLSRATFKLECWFANCADLIIVNSKAGLDYHLDCGFPGNKMVVIPNGINTELFKPKPEARTKVRKEWKIAENTILIGLVGRLDPMKDHPTFLKAAAILSQQRQNVKFVCVGSGTESYTQKLYQLTHDLGLSAHIIWAGTCLDMPGVYNALDIASSSSSYGEGFPNVVGEAMACGIPCVTTDVGDSAWIVGDTGIVVPAKNPEALAMGWLTCLARNRKLMGEDARTRIIQEFSVNNLVRHTTKLINEVSSHAENNSKYL